MVVTTRTEPRSPRLDDSLDETIVAAAARLLAEVGYDAMSMEAVAARAGVGKATIYRRWPGKEALVLDTVRSRDLRLGEVSDTGTLRGDLLELFLGLQARLGGDEALEHLFGVLVAMRRHPLLGEAVHEQFVARWARGGREIVERAVARGEIERPPDAVLELFTKTGPSVVALRYLLDDGPIDADLMTMIVDDILLPILHRA